MNSFKCEIPFIGESARIMKPMRAMKLAPESKVIPHLEGVSFLLQKDEEPTFDRKVMMREDDLLGLNPQLRCATGEFWGTIQDPLY
jgi:hypothetical protein